MKYRMIFSSVPFWGIFFALSIFVPACGYAQNIKTTGDTAAINRLLKYADKILNPDSAIRMFDSVIYLSKCANFADAAFTALMIKGVRLYGQSKFPESRECDLEAMKWAEKTTRKEALGWCFNNLGLTYYYEGDYTLAADYYFKALEELKKKDYLTSAMGVNIYLNLGLINLSLKQDDKVMYYFKRAEDIALAGNFNYQLSLVYLNMGEFMDDPDSALKYYFKVKDISKKIGKIDLEAYSTLDIGNTLVKKDEFEKALNYIRQAGRLAKNRYLDIVIDAEFGLGFALHHMKRYKEAEDSLLCVIQEVKSLNMKTRYIPYYNELIDVYKESGKYKKAIECMDSVSVFKDSLTNTEKAKAINLMELKYKTAEKDKQIAQNQLLIARQKNNITQKNIWIVSIIAGIFMVTLLFVLLHRHSLHKEKLQSEKIKTLEKENTIGILKGMVQGEERERTRLARELHDGIGGLVSASMMRFMALRHDVPAVETTAAYNDGINLLEEIGDEIRKTAHNLMPEVLLKQTLAEAINTYCNSVTNGGDLHLAFQSYGTFDHLRENFKLNVYRIVQELLKNIIRHAGATQALVQLVMNANILTVTVEDNGTGFDTTVTYPGLGLKNIETRVSSLNGHITIESEKGKGTSVFIEFELDHDPQTNAI